MKILQICPVFPPEPLNFSSGVTNVVLNLSKKLVKQGHDVHIYTSAALNPKEQIKNIKNPVIIDGIKVYHFPYIFKYYKSAFFMTLKMAGYLNQNVNSFDIIHIHEHRNFQSVLTHYYAMKYNVPYFIQSHGTVLQDYQNIKVKRIFDFIIGYKILRDSTRAIAITNKEVKDYINMGIPKEKIEIIPNGVDEFLFDKVTTKNGFKEKYHLSENEKIILYLGRINKTKGIKLIVKSFYELSKTLDDILLVLAGPFSDFQTELESMIKKLKIEDKVLFTGPLYYSDKVEAYLDADVFITPSFTGFPLTFLEAAACGTPIVTTNKGDKLDWINNQVGLVVDYNQNAIKNAINEILTDENLKTKLSKNGNKIAEKYNWYNASQKLASLYRKSVKK